MLLPKDMAHVPSFTAAMDALVVPDSARVLTIQALHAHMLIWLKSRGMDTLPLGSVTRLLRDVGLGIEREGEHMRYVHGIRMRDGWRSVLELGGSDANRPGRKAL